MGRVKPMVRPGAETESLAQAVIQSSIDGLAAMDRDTRYLLWNPKMEVFSGKKAAEVLGQKMFELFPFLRDHGIDKAMERVLAGETVMVEAGEHFSPDGVRYVLDRLYVPMRSASGEVNGALAIVRDATARYAAQDQLGKSEAKLRMTAEATGVGLWSWDPGSDTISWDDTMLRLFGLAPGSAPRDVNGYLALVHPDERARATERIRRGLPSGGWSEEYRIVRGDGTVRWILGKGRLLRSDGR